MLHAPGQLRDDSRMWRKRIAKIHNKVIMFQKENISKNTQQVENWLFTTVVLY